MYEPFSHQSTVQTHVTIIFVEKYDNLKNDFSQNDGKDNNGSVLDNRLCCDHIIITSDQLWEDANYETAKIPYSHNIFSFHKLILIQTFIATIDNRIDKRANQKHSIGKVIIICIEDLKIWMVIVCPGDVSGNQHNMYRIERKPSNWLPITLFSFTQFHATFSSTFYNDFYEISSPDMLFNVCPYSLKWKMLGKMLLDVFKHWILNTLYGQEQRFVFNFDDLF